MIQVFDAGSSLWEYRYTVAGNIATVTAPTAQGNRSFAYDVRQFLVAETTGESGTIVYERNALGQMTRRTDARQAVASYLHADPLGRLTGIEYLGGAADDVTQHHDNSNNVTHVSTASGGGSTTTMTSSIARHGRLGAGPRQASHSRRRRFRTTTLRGAWIRLRTRAGSRSR